MSSSSLAQETKGPRLLAATWTLASLCSLFLGVRLFCKIFKGRGLWWDDHLLIFSWVCVIVTSCCFTVAVALGYGHHAQFIDPDNVLLVTIYSEIGGTPNMVAVATSKCAFALTLIRLTKGRIRIFLWFLVCSVSIFMFLANLFLYIKCTPVNKNWDYSVQGTCWDIVHVVRFNTFAGAYSAVADFILAFIGAYTVWSLQMRPTEKIGVAIAMSMGIFAGITSVMKCVYLNQIMVMDYSWDGYDLQVWGLAETSTTIIAASIPILRVLFKEVKATVTRSRATAAGYGADRSFRLKTTKNGSWQGSRLSRTTKIHVERLDSQSEQSILREPRAKDVIITTEVDVEWGQKQRDEESDHEPRTM